MNLERIAEIAREHYITAVERSYGARGIEVIRGLLPSLNSIYSVIDYESISGSLTVFRTLSSSARPLPEAEAYKLSGVDDIPVHNLGTLTLHVLEGGKFLLWKRDTAPINLPSDTIIYRYEPDKGERFWVDGTERKTEVSGFPRLFGSPTFFDLSEALDHYAISMVRYCDCAVLAEAWREEGRAVWKARPEIHMRRSLYQYLRSALRNGRPDVHQESPADDKNPVDITVRWADSNRIALIEIKWLGHSGLLDPPRLTTQYRENRAHDGLRQLVDYLELTRARAPKYDRRGYLAVFDGRRDGTTVETMRCDPDLGMAYADAHIVYDQALLDRHDVARPVRFFCEPKRVFNSPSRGG